MHPLTLLIGNRNYSSWSLRGWLMLELSGVPFQVQQVSLMSDEWNARRVDLSPSGLVPVLRDGNFEIWDSLAICEYVNERFDSHVGWPADPMARARARSISAEMHSGFGALRERMPMNCRRRVQGFTPDPATSTEISRIQCLWQQCLSTWGGPWLFGALSIADVMYAPVASRFVTYAVALEPACQSYVDQVMALPAMQAWTAAAGEEKEVIASAEAAADAPPGAGEEGNC